MKLQPGHTVGIDLGTSYSALCMLDESGQPVVVKNANGDPLTSSIVQLGAQHRVAVGPTPEMMIADPDSTVVAIKRHMGSHDFFKVYDGKKLTPEFISAMILRKLKQDAEKQIGPIGNAVITVPYYFNDPCRRATLQAGQIAGFNVIDIINEPTAATLAYAWMVGQLGTKTGAGAAGGDQRTILVYDLGGGTFDVTVVRYTPTNFSVVATDGDTFLGGLDWTRRIMDHVALQFQQRFGIDPREEPHKNAELQKVCEDAKRDLSQRVRTTVDLTFQNRALTVSLTRTEVEQLAADLLQRTRDTTELVLDLAKVDPKTLDEVVLVGGSTHIPSVVQMLTDLCGRKPSMALDPQLAVAQGAAIHAAILEARASGEQGRMAKAVLNRLRSIRQTDVNSHSLGIEISDPSSVTRKRNHVMIPRNSALPVEVRQRFVTDVPNPQGIRIRLLEGEASDVRACTYVGDFRISNLPPTLPAGSPVEVTYRYDAQRRIHVTARELTGGNHASVDIVWEGVISPDAVSAFQSLAASYQVS